jgi:limonene-1,2-epoxide hydrolase
VGILRNVSHVLAALFNDRADFQRRWNDPSTPEERWQGEWVSETNGHRGVLKCLLTKTESGEYQATFYAVYARLLSVAYSVPLHGRRDAGKLKLEGQADLGQLAGGIYHYKGEADETAFNCTYRCKYDHGTFQLKLF